MRFYSEGEMERTMKVQEVILQALAKRIIWWQAAEILEISARQMKRWKQRYEEYGYDGLFDRQRQRPSPRRVAVETVEQVLSSYPERYFDFNVRHFHEKLRGKHRIQLSHSWGEGIARGGVGGEAEAAGRGMNGVRSHYSLSKSRCWARSINWASFRAT
jgi:transposase